jgi:hypothetical protein
MGCYKRIVGGAELCKPLSLLVIPYMEWLVIKESWEVQVVKSINIAIILFIIVVFYSSPGKAIPFPSSLACFHCFEKSGKL